MADRTGFRAAPRTGFARIGSAPVSASVCADFAPVFGVHRFLARARAIGIKTDAGRTDFAPPLPRVAKPVHPSRAAPRGMQQAGRTDS
jgi:hypothetical protein